MELKGSIHIKNNKSFSKWDDGLLRYQVRLCVLLVDGLREKSWKRIMAPDIPFILGPPKCIMIFMRFIGGM